MDDDFLEMGGSGPSRFGVLGFKAATLVELSIIFCVILSSIIPKPLLKAWFHTYCRELGSVPRFGKSSEEKSSQQLSHGGGSCHGGHIWSAGWLSLGWNRSPHGMY